MNDFLTGAGRLKEEFLPAVYFDSSVLIDYWMTEGMELEEVEAQRALADEMLLGPVATAIRDLMRSDRRLSKVAEIRKKLLFEEVKVRPVASPLGRLELTEWHAEAVFKQTAAEASGALFIQRKGKKEIGDYIKKALERWQCQQEGAENTNSTARTGLDDLVSSMWISGSFSDAHGLAGIIQVDIVNFNLPADDPWETPSVPDPFVFAYLQLGVADTLHILLAHHLGCQYIASFDSDFKRVRGEIMEETGLIALVSPEEILAVL